MVLFWSILLRTGPEDREIQTGGQWDKLMEETTFVGSIYTFMWVVIDQIQKHYFHIYNRTTASVVSTFTARGRQSYRINTNDDVKIRQPGVGVANSHSHVFAVVLNRKFPF